MIDDRILTDEGGNPMDVNSKNENECWVSLMGKFMAKWHHWNDIHAVNVFQAICGFQDSGLLYFNQFEEHYLNKSTPLHNDF